MFKKIRRYCRDPYYQIGKFVFKHFPNIMPDKWYLQVMWLNNMGYKIDLKHPKTYNEKLQWLKLYDRNSLYTTLVDKYRVKQWVADKIGEEYVIPTLAVYQSVDEIDLNKLPNQFVLKCNHDSGSFVICRDKKHFDLEAAKRKLDKGFKTNFYKIAREWPYKNVKRCIIAEQYLEDKTFGDLVNYKFICINGKPEIMYITVKNDDIWENFYDMDFKQIDFTHGRHVYKHPIEKPQMFEKMKHVASQLAADVPNVRIDFYVVENKLYFSEYTFYDWGGFAQIQPNKWDEQLGNIMQLVDNQNVKRVCRGGVNDDNTIYFISDALVDYKFFCFNGEPQIMYIGADKADEPTSDFYDMEFDHLPIKMVDPNAKTTPNKPACFEQMKQIAATLSKGIPHVRVDFYYVNNKVYFGEFTFYHMGGFSEVKPYDWSVKLGEYITKI